MNSNLDELSTSDIEDQILNALNAIHETTLKINNELSAINVLIQKNGQLHTAVTDANKTLMTVAQDMQINVKNILEDNEEDNEKDDEVTFNLGSVLTPSVFREKILQCLNNT